MRQHTAPIPAPIAEAPPTGGPVLGEPRRRRGEQSGNAGERERAEAPVRLARADVERMMEGRPPGSTLEEALEVFEVFSSGTLADEVYVLEDVGGKRIAIAPAALKAKYRKE